MCRCQVDNLRAAGGLARLCTVHDGAGNLMSFILSSIPIYLLSHMVLPRALVERLEQLFRAFFGGPA